MRHGQGNQIGGRGPARRLTTVIAVAVAAFLAFAGSAQASVISIGSVLPEKFEATEFVRPQTLFNTALPEPGATLASPVNGAIVKWRVLGASGGPFYLRILHPNGKGAYEAAGTSSGESPKGEGLEEFSTNLKIKAGDLIGLDPTNGTDKIGVAEASGSKYEKIFPRPVEGSVVPPTEPVSGKEIELSALIQPQPEVALVSPPLGPVTGGTIVTITGQNFSQASEVKFGATPAASFKIDSDTEITATTPKALLPGQVDVAVTTFAGTNPNTHFDDFVYTACVVPRVKDHTLKVAKAMLRRAGCKLGHVKKVDAPKPKKVGKVLKQSPNPGKVLAPGSRVRIQLGK